MKFSRLLTAVAAAGMLVSPIAAQAGTRAASAPAYRASLDVAGEQNAMPRNVLLLVLALIPLTYGTIKAFDEKSNGS